MRTKCDKCEHKKPKNGGDEFCELLHWNGNRPIFFPKDEYCDYWDDCGDYEEGKR